MSKLEFRHSTTDASFERKPCSNKKIRSEKSSDHCDIRFLGLQTLINQDCLAGLRALPDKIIDVVVTSPPYNIGIDYNTHNDKMIHDHYLQWLQNIWQEINRVLTIDGSFFLNVAGTSKEPLKAFEIALQASHIFTLQNSIIWAKSLTVGQNSFGHFKPINSKRYLNNNFEHVFHFTKSGAVELDRLSIGVPFKDKSNIARFGHKQDKRCGGNIWHIPYKTVVSKSQKFNHPATYPEELVERCIKLHGKRKPRVLDPFVGTGTTLIACEKLACPGIGFEIDRSYFDVATQRLENAKKA